MKLSSHPPRTTLILLSAVVVLTCGFLVTAVPAVAAGKEQILYNFCVKGDGCPDGASPEAPLILDAAGDLYGTTYEGGVYNRNCAFGYGGGCGTVFELIRQGNGKWALPSLCRATPSAPSERFLGLIDSSPIPPSSSLLAFPFN